MGGVPWSEGESKPTTITKHVAELHEALSSDRASVRTQIDAHLLAFYVDGKNPNPMLVLKNEDVYHYTALPDLMRYMRDSIANNDWTQTAVAVLMAPFCLQIKRQMNKQTPAKSTRSERVAIINLLHGLLLGLYPYNLKHMTFDHRVKIAGEMHRVMTSDSARQTRFIVDNEPLLLFAMIEYLSNVIPDFCPVEERLLIRSIQCRYSLNQICETFRASCMDVILKPGRMQWAAINDLATAQLPVLLRQLKINNQKFCRRPYVCPRIPQSVWSTLTECYDTLMGMRHVAGCNMIAQIKIINPDLSFDELQAVEYFWNNVFTSVLPGNIIMQQMEALDRVGSCSVHQASFMRIHVCLLCALKTKTSILSQKFAFNCTSSTLQCATCSRVATPVHMLGRVLRVKSHSYYLCTSCLKPALWEAGSSFHTCKNCIQQQQPQNMATCAICDHKAVDAAANILHIETLKMVRVPLCSLHARMCISSTVYDIKSLVSDLHQKAKPY